MRAEMVGLERMEGPVVSVSLSEGRTQDLRRVSLRESALAPTSSV